MEDELDPAFLDLDLPSQGGASLLGAGFGSVEFDEHDEGEAEDADPLDAHQHELDFDLDHELGAGASELGPLDTAAHDPPSTHSNLGGSGFATPARRRAAPPSAGGLSLAAELASAARPLQQRDLMRELGLDDEDEDEGSAADERNGEAYSDEDVDEEEPTFGAGFGRVTPALGDGDGFLDGSPRRTTSSLARTRPSTASLASHTPDEADADEAAQEEVELALQGAAASLEESMATTSAFLAHLRQHVTAEVDPHASDWAAPRPPTLAVNGSLERCAAATTPSPNPPLDYTDRQPVVEAHTSTLVRRLYDLANQREMQLRELGEMERVVGRTEFGWQAILAELDPFEDFDDDDGDADAEADSVEPNGVPPPPSADEHQSESSSLSSHGAISPKQSPRSRASVASTAALARAHDDLGALRTLTLALLAALSSISDLAQVQSALASDAGRKLRALKAQAGAVRDELGAAERSEAFVRLDAARARTIGEGRAAASARREVEGVRERLEEGWRSAQSILAVRA